MVANGKEIETKTSVFLNGISLVQLLIYLNELLSNRF